MDITEILLWVEKNKASITIESGPSYLYNNLGELDYEKMIKEEGNSGFFVEISLNEDCAGFAYKRSLIEAIKSAFSEMINFGVELSVIDKQTYNLFQQIDKFIIDDRIGYVG